jgi:hypothetical protein
MTAFITHYWQRRLERALLLIAGLLAFNVMAAGSIEPKSASLVPDERGLVVHAEFAVKLGSRLVEAVERSVPLHFRFEFELTRKRWYWADEHVAGKVLDTRLTYHALTRQYRLSQGGQQRNFETLDEALQALGKVSRLAAPLQTELIPGETYRAAVRLSLDHEQLPKPLQIDALADPDWRVSARTHTWNFLPATDKQ